MNAQKRIERMRKYRHRADHKRTTRFAGMLELSQRLQEGSITVSAARNQLGYYEFL